VLFFIAVLLLLDLRKLSVQATVLRGACSGRRRLLSRQAPQRKKSPPPRWTVGAKTMRAAMEQAAQHRYAVRALL